VQVTWTPPAVRPDRGYDLVRVDTGAVVVTSLPAATSAIISGLPRGQFQFIVVADDSTGRYPSAPSNFVATFGLPAGPQVNAALAARSPTAFQLSVSIAVTDDGGSPITSYDISATYTTGNGDAKQATAVPIGQNPYLLTMDCRGTADPCLAGGPVTITVALTSAAGTGAPTTTVADVSPPNLWAYNRPALFVTVDGRCLDASFTVQPCTGSVSQMWIPSDRGSILNQARPGQCLRNGSAISFTVDDCTSDSRRWNRVLLAANGNGAPIANSGFLQGENPHRCIYASGGGVNLRQPCFFNDEERLYIFTITIPMALAVTSGAQATAPAPPDDNSAVLIGLPLVAALLLPIVFGLVRLRRRARRSDGVRLE
jgi:hypothetical protein